MASASALILLLFLISWSLPSSSQEIKEKEEFDEWISLNVKHYKRETSLKWMQESIKHKKQQLPPPSSPLDPKLIYAEMNKIIITVSQDGSGNFKTIKEALVTIPLYNKRRVIIDIKPGVYRYVSKIFTQSRNSHGATDSSPLGNLKIIILCVNTHSIQQ